MRIESFNFCSVVCYGNLDMGFFCRFDYIIGIALIFFYRVVVRNNE